MLNPSVPTGMSNSSKSQSTPFVVGALLENVGDFSIHGRKRTSGFGVQKTYFLNLNLFICLVFLGLHPCHMEDPRLGVKSELQLLTCSTAAAMPDLSRICDLHHSS